MPNAFIVETKLVVDSSTLIPGEIAANCDDNLDIVFASSMLYPRRLHLLLLFSKRKGVGHFCLPLQFHYSIIVAEQSTSSPCAYAFRCSACKYVLLHTKLTRYGFKVFPLCLALGITLLRCFSR